MKLVSRDRQQVDSQTADVRDNLTHRLDGIRVHYEAALTSDGWLVTVEAYDTDWHATVDGHPAPVLRANLAFRAVPVPAGRHVVDQRYRPPAITRGLVLSGLGLLAALGLVFLRRQTPPA